MPQEKSNSRGDRQVEVMVEGAAPQKSNSRVEAQLVVVVVEVVEVVPAYFDLQN